MGALRIQPFRVSLKGPHFGTGPESIPESFRNPGPRHFIMVFEVYDLRLSVANLQVLLIKPTL
jgi:hypothetical protein